MVQIESFEGTRYRYGKWRATTMMSSLKFKDKGKWLAFQLCRKRKKHGILTTSKTTSQI